jgi:thioredoxin 1
MGFILSFCSDRKKLTLSLPCRYAAEDKYKDIYFVKIDVDKLNDLSKECNVRNMPTFQLYKDGEKITQVAEPKPNDLTEFLAKAL